ncbi:MAG: hypothetical protein ACREUS_05530 [Burkholderiales bacterium]
MRRRDLLLGAAAVFLVRDALAQDRVRQGVNRVRGAATINGQPAKQGMAVRAGDTVATAKDAEIAVVVGRDAMLVRQNSSVSVVQGGLRLATGAVLAVFAPKQRRELRTPTASIGIRGTAVYLEAESSRTYVCTCYGEAVLEPAGDPAARETVRTTHHEQPRYIMARGAPQRIMPAPVQNHTDAELELLEGLVQRQPPFAGKGYRRY